MYLLYYLLILSCVIGCLTDIEGEYDVTDNTTTTEKTEITASVQQSTIILSVAVALSLIVCIVIVVVFKMRGKSKYLYSDNTFILYTDDKQHFP